MLLTDLCARYALEHDITAATVGQYEFAVGSFSKFLAKFIRRDSTASDFADDPVNGWIVASLESGKSRATVKSQRGALLVLWRYAAELKLCEPPNRIRKVGLPEPNPVAWRVEEVRAIADESKRVDGFFPCGVERAKLLYAMILTHWYTGLRTCDLLAIRVGQIRPDGSLVVVQKKTGRRWRPVRKYAGRTKQLAFTRFNLGFNQSSKRTCRRISERHRRRHREHDGPRCGGN